MVTDHRDTGGTAEGPEKVPVSVSSKKNKDGTVKITKSDSMKELLDTPIPIVILKKARLPSPTAGSSPDTPSGKAKDYKTLYRDLRRKTLEQTETNTRNMSKAMADQESVNNNKDSIITKQREELKRLSKQIKDLQAEKGKLIGEQSIVKLKRKKSEEMIRTKSKAKPKKDTPAVELKCDLPQCVNNGVESLIRCNACDKWVCEICSDLLIAKLKPTINKCSTIFFACKGCVDLTQDPDGMSVVGVTGPEAASTANNNPDSNLVTSMKSLFKDHVSQIESKLENMIEKKLNEKMPILGINDSATTSKQHESYARKVLQVPAEVRKIIQEAKNDDKVEESEHEKRSTNFIIHGAKEFGETIDITKKLDAEYIDDILKHLGIIQQQPENIVRVGNPNNSNSRPIKVSMKTKAEKQKVMSRLNRLKDTEEEFGKISITEDYTQTERDQIKSWCAKAKEQSSQDETFVYKVRGDPKNGLKIIRLMKKV